MTVFKYKAFQADGRPILGEINALSQESAEARLADQKLSLVYLVQGGKAEPDHHSSSAPHPSSEKRQLGRKRVTTEDACDLLRSMAVMCRSGVSLVDSLDTIVANAASDSITEIGLRIKADILEGKSLSQGMSAFPESFPEIVCEMVGVADEGGQLAQALSNATSYLEERNTVRKSVGAALVYPIMLLAICCFTTLGFMVFILPTFAQTFSGMNVKLPAITQMLMDLGTFLQKNLAVLALLIVGSPFAVRRIMQFPQARRTVANLTYRLPLFGPVVKLMALGRSFSTLASLLGTNIPIIRALEYAGKVAHYETLVLAFAQVRMGVESGNNLADAMGETNEFPPMTVQLVSVGERSGQLSELLVTAAGQLQSQAERKLRALLALMEPALIVVMGVLIGTLTLSILMPLFQLNSNIK